MFVVFLRFTNGRKRRITSEEYSRKENMPARFGVAQIPMGSCLEIELILELAD